MKTDAKHIKKLYYSISEVSDLTELKPYVLRYWETEFKQLSPSKNRAGNRTYSQKDIDIILHIKDLLYNRKHTIKGAREIIENRDSFEDEYSVNLKSKDDAKNKVLTKLKQELESLLDYLHKN